MEARLVKTFQFGIGHYGSFRRSVGCFNDNMRCRTELWFCYVALLEPKVEKSSTLRGNTCVSQSNRIFANTQAQAIANEIASMLISKERDAEKIRWWPNGCIGT